MKIATLALAGAVIFATRPAAAADSAGMMKSIDGFIAASLTGKPVDRYLTGSPNMSDEVPPYHWSGPGGAKQWLTDVGGWARANGVTGLAVRLGAPTRPEQSGSHGYVVAPAVFTYKRKGQAEREEAKMVFTLDRTRSGWRIASFAWTGGPTRP